MLGCGTRGQSPEPAFILSALKLGTIGSLVTEVGGLTAEREAIDAETARISQILQLPGNLATPDALFDRLSDMRAAAADPSGLMERARLRKAEDTLRDQGFTKLGGLGFVGRRGFRFDAAWFYRAIHYCQVDGRQGL